jgi:hypothetical protein
MNDEDRILARRVLDRKRLTSDQVHQVLAECGRSGRSFRDIALGRGLASVQDFEVLPPKQLPTAQVLLIFAGLMLLMGLALMATRYFQVRSQSDGGQPPRSEQRPK